MACVTLCILPTPNLNTSSPQHALLHFVLLLFSFIFAQNLLGTSVHKTFYFNKILITLERFSEEFKVTASIDNNRNKDLDNQRRYLTGF